MLIVYSGKHLPKDKRHCANVNQLLIALIQDAHGHQVEATNLPAQI